jgi:hypothetical protein
MGKHKFPWHEDIERWVGEGLDLKAAQTRTILTWMERGNLGPLADVITDGQRLEPVVLHCLASMIFKRTLVVKRGRARGRPRQLGKSVRDSDVARRYEKLRARLYSDDAFQQVADEFRTTSASARKALTHWRKRNKISRRRKRNKISRRHSEK